ncbi:MAG: glycosyltransferase family 39 protein [archaeon]
MKFSRSIRIFAILSIFIFSAFNIYWNFNSNKVYSEDVVESLFLVDPVYDNFVQTGSLNFQSFFAGGESIFITIFYFTIFLVFGVKSNTLYLINLILLLLSILILYNTFKKIFDDDTAGLFIIIFLGLPGTVLMSRMLYEHMFLLFFFSLSLHFLVALKKFQDRALSILFGLSLGMLALTRHPAFPYVASFVLFVATKYKSTEKPGRDLMIRVCESIMILLILIWDYYRLCIGGLGMIECILSVAVLVGYFRKRKQSKLSNLVDSLSIFIWMSAPVYIFKFHSLLTRYSGEMIVESEYILDFTRFLVVFLQTHTNLVVCFLIVICGAIFLKRKNEFKSFFLYLIAIPFIFFGLFPIKSDQALFPVLMPTSIIIASAFKKKYILTLFFFVAVMYYSFPFENQINIGFQINNEKIPVFSRLHNRYYIHEPGTVSRFSVMKRDYLQSALALMNLSAGSPIKLLTMTTLSAFESDVILFKSLESEKIPRIIALDYTNFDQENITEIIMDFDYAIIEKDYTCMVPEPKFIRFNETALHIYNYFSKTQKEYERISEFNYSDNCTLIIYRSTQPAFSLP